MSLNIKNAEAHRLAAELARVTGKTLTQAVTDALRAELARETSGPDPRVERLLAIGRDCAARMADPFQSADHGHFLYDEKGLPRRSSIPRQ